MTSVQAVPGCDTHDMVVVHRVFRREFALLPRMVLSVTEGDVAQMGVIVDHAREMVTVLHHHHAAEDALLWPRLREHLLEPWLVERMETQHLKIAALLTRLDEALELFTTSLARAEIRADLADVLDRLSTALDEHLDEEEAAILPIVARTLTGAEWHELARRGMAALSKPRLLVLLGHILEEADEAEKASFLAHIPLPARIGYGLVGRRRHARETAVQRRPLTGTLATQ